MLPNLAFGLWIKWSFSFSLLSSWKIVQLYTTIPDWLLVGLLVVWLVGFKDTEVNMASFLIIYRNKNLILLIFELMFLLLDIDVWLIRIC